MYILRTFEVHCILNEKFNTINMSGVNRKHSKKAIKFDAKKFTKFLQETPESKHREYMTPKAARKMVENQKKRSTFGETLL